LCNVTTNSCHNRFAHLLGICTGHDYCDGG
jgi:hypothetical protein